MCIIELNDSGVLVSRNAELVLNSPGYVLVSGEEVETGEAARGQARLHPRRSHNQFWHRLSLDPLANPTPRYRHHADLAYAHLQHIAGVLEQDSEIVFAVPSNYSKEQLALLLGIAQESALSVVGLVDSAVAAVASRPVPRAECIFLDIQLHQASAVALDVAGTIQRRNIEVLDRTGLSLMYDRWVQLIADAFIEQCRFDPLHNAETEQALYLRLPEWLHAVSEGNDVVLEIESGGKQFQSRLKGSKAIATITPAYQRIARMLENLQAGTRHQLLISHRVASLPGLEAVLGDCEVLPENAVALGCGANMDVISSGEDGVSFVTALPAMQVAAAGDQQAEPPQSESAVTSAAVTHVLSGQHAWSLRSTLFVGLGNDGSGLCLGYEVHEVGQLLASIVNNGTGAQIKVHGDGPLRLNGNAIAEVMLLAAGDQLTATESGQPVIAISEIEHGAQA